MENMDNRIDEESLHHDEDELLLNHVIQGDHELYYLDVCMHEICRPQQDSGS